MACLLLAAVSLHAQILLQAGSKEIIAGFSSQKNNYEIGGLFGHWLLAGEANFMECNYRSAVRFDLARFIPAGKVNKAILKTSQSHFGYRDETAALEILNEEWPVLAPGTLISNQARRLVEYTLKNGEKNRQMDFDVTSVVNANLQQGIGSAVLRFVSVTAPAEGNAKGEACGVTIHENNLYLEIYP